MSQKEGLSRDELREVRRCAARRRKSGGALDLALVQLLREHLWRTFRVEVDLNEAKTLLPLLFAARRLELLEQREAEEKKQLTAQQQEGVVRTIYGPLPWLDAN